MYDKILMLQFLQSHAQTCMMWASSFPRRSKISRILEDQSQTYMMRSQMWLSWCLIMDDDDDDDDDDNDDDFMEELEDILMKACLEDMNRINHLLQHHNNYDENDENDEDEEDEEEEENEEEEDPVTDMHNDPIRLDSKFDSRRNLNDEINLEIERDVPKEIYEKTSVESKTTMENKTGRENGRDLKRKASNEETIMMSSDDNNVHGKKKKSVK